MTEQILFDVGDITMHVDPTNKFSDISKLRLLKACGYLPEWLILWGNDDAEDTDIVGFLNKQYAHGGGWQPFRGHMKLDDGTLQYPGDPPMPPLLKLEVKGHTVFQYQHAWVCIVFPDGHHEVAGMD